MTIAIELCGRDQFRIRILKGPQFDANRDAVKRIPGKKPIYHIDPITFKSTFKHWEVPRNQIAKIDAMFDRPSIIFESDHVKKLFDRLDNLRTPLQDLPKIEGPIAWPKTGPLWECQEDYVRLNRDRTRLICAFDPGVGKSWASLLRASVLGYRKLLIIVPGTQLRVNWRTQIWNHLGKDCLIYHGTVKQRAKIKAEQLRNAEIIVTSYTMIHEVLDVQVDQIIFDEAHMLAHANTLTFTRAQRLVKTNPDAGIQLLSGTPILHKPKDLWAPVSLIYPELAGDYKDWENRYEEVLKSFLKKFYAKDKNGRVKLDALGHPILLFTKKIPLVTRTCNLDELGERIKPFLMRVKRDGLVHFADAVDIVTVGMTDRQRKLYQQIRKDVLLNLETRDLKITNALSEMTRLLQVAEGAYNIEPTWTKDSGKLQYVDERIEDDKDKLAAWLRFKPGTYIQYEKHKKEAVLFNGDLTPNQKALAIWSFQGVTNEKDEAEFKRIAPKGWRFEPGEARLFFGTIDKVSSLGFDLHACSKQIVPSFTWNGGVNQQACDRIKRPEQKATDVYTTFLVAERSIEYHALQIVLTNLKNCHHILDGVQDITYNQMHELVEKLKNDRD